MVAMTEMSEKRRKLTIEVFDGCPQVLPLLHEIHQFVRADDILLWLIRNKIKGSRFFEFYSQFEFSKIRFGKYVLTQIEHSKKLNLIAGKDLH